MKHIAITGANGFVGQYLVKYFAALGLKITAFLRQPHEGLFEHASVKYVVIGDLNAQTNFKSALQDVDGVIHCAARVHIMKPTAEDEALFHQTNVEGTQKLFKDAKAANVKQFIFLSTIKVNGESTQHVPFKEDDIPNPQDMYARSKWLAESALWEMAQGTSCHVTVLRLPLVYGPKVKGNLAKLTQALQTRQCLPLRSIRNKRSFLALPNLASAIASCMDNEQAKGQTFLLADDADLSTPELIELLAQSQSVTARLISCPVFLLKLLGVMTGRASEISRLVQSLQVDVQKIKNELQWKPLVKPDDIFKASS